MATRDFTLEASDGWVDLSASVTPALVAQKLYTLSYTGDSRMVALEAETEPASAATGGLPVTLPYFYFYAPTDPKKLWVRVHGPYEVQIFVTPADRGGDGAS